jgi:putative acetyltransferase
MSAIRPETPRDHAAIRQLLTEAFGQPAEADLVDRLRADSDLLLSLVAEEDGAVVGHVAFSRLIVDGATEPYPAVALAPLAVAADKRRQGIGRRLVQAGHGRLVIAGESFFVVLGDPAYYGRFHYRRDLAAAFQSAYQGDALMALAFGNPPLQGSLRYARAFQGL